MKDEWLLPRDAWCKTSDASGVGALRACALQSDKVVSLDFAVPLNRCTILTSLSLTFHL